MHHKKRERNAILQTKFKQEKISDFTIIKAERVANIVILRKQNNLDDNESKVKEF